MSHPSQVEKIEYKRLCAEAPINRSRTRQPAGEKQDKSLEAHSRETSLTGLCRRDSWIIMGRLEWNLDVLTMYLPRYLVRTYGSHWVHIQTPVIRQLDYVSGKYITHFDIWSNALLVRLEHLSMYRAVPVTKIVQAQCGRWVRVDYSCVQHLPHPSTSRFQCDGRLFHYALLSTPIQSLFATKSLSEPKVNHSRAWQK